MRTPTSRLAPVIGSLGLVLGVALFGSLVAGGGACSPYDPQLPSQPFRCNATEPKCPDGYACVDLGANKQVCEPGAAGVDAGPTIDAAPLTCNNDAILEPNDTIAQASPSGVQDQRKSFKLVGVAICPATDKDTFLVTITAANTNIEAIATVTGGDPVKVSILNSTGISVTDGVASAGSTRAYLANAPQGTYYVQIFGTATSRSNYDLQINSTP
jgi:hypothetical protein